MMYMTIRCRYCRGVREDNAERYRRGRASTPGATGPLCGPLGRLFLGPLLLVHTMADLSEEDAAAEHAAFARVLAAFRAYPRFAVRCPSLPRPARSLTRAAQLAANQRRRRDFYALPRADREVLGALGYAEKLNAVDDAIAANARFLLEVVSDPEIFANQAAEEASAEEEERTGMLARLASGKPS
jgi:hypothetical protein